MKEIDGLGLTRQRKAVLRVIYDSEEHMTANEVFERARGLEPGISFATVYNSLRYLRDQGLIGEVHFGADAALYDRNLDRHDHAVCTRCGRLADLKLTIPDKLMEEAAKISRFEPESIEIIVRGLCANCRD